MLSACFLDQTAHPLPIKSHEVIHVLELRFIRHVGRDTGNDWEEMNSMINQNLGECLAIDCGKHSLSFDRICRSLLYLVNEIIDIPSLVRIHVRRANGSGGPVLSQSPIE